ncbi:MAG TPA: hypothetical protein VKQ52_21790 [Puia sp.]|nr:hypothetical protein [Puia sp.]
MEYPNTQDVLTLPPDYKLYKDRDISIATFLGGPPIAGYLAAENFKRLGETRKARVAWIIAIVVTILIFASVFLIPGIERIPSYLIPLIYSTLARFLVQKYQGAELKAHAFAGGQFYNVWRAVLISLIGLAVLLGLLFALIYLADTPPA